jgi:hypothetical protein
MVGASPSDVKTLNKGYKVSCEAFRLFPVGRVSGILIHHQPRLRNSAEEDIVIPAGTERVSPTPDQERGCLDFVFLARKIVF